MALTAQQLSTLRRRVGDSNSAFTDDVLNAIWDDVSGATSDTVRIEAALYLMWEAVVAGAVKLHDVTAGQTSNKLSQVFSHAEAMMKTYKKSYDLATGQRKLIAIGSLRPTSNYLRQYPSDHDCEGQ